MFMALSMLVRTMMPLVMMMMMLMLFGFFFFMLLILWFHWSFIHIDALQSKVDQRPDHFLVLESSLESELILLLFKFKTLNHC